MAARRTVLPLCLSLLMLPSPWANPEWLRLGVPFLLCSGRTRCLSGLAASPSARQANLLRSGLACSPSCRPGEPDWRSGLRPASRPSSKLAGLSAGLCPTFLLPGEPGRYSVGHAVLYGPGQARCRAAQRDPADLAASALSRASPVGRGCAAFSPSKPGVKEVRGLVSGSFCSTGRQRYPVGLRVRVDRRSS